MRGAALRTRAADAGRSPLFKVVGARAVTFPVSAVCGLLWLSLVIGHLGPADYAFVAVVVGLQFVVFFLDFGTGSAVLEETGRYRALAALDPLAAAVGRAWRVIVTGNLLLLLVAVALALAGSWGPILGFADRGATAGEAVVLTLTVNLFARPLSLGAALVAGLGRAAVATWSQALTSVTSLALVALCIAGNAPLPLVVATPVVGQLMATLVPFTVAMRAVPGLLRASLRAAMTTAGAVGKVGHIAVPMLLIQLIGPLNTNLDRLALGHLSTVEMVAVYSLAVQLSASAESFLSVLQPALWAEYAERRAVGGMRSAVLRSFLHVRRFWLLGVAFGAAFAVVAFLFGPVVAHGELHLPWALCAILGATLPVLGVQLVLGIALTDAAGLRAQVVLVMSTTALNVALTFAWASRLGAVGPALASLITALVHVPLLWVLARRRLRREPSGGRAAAG
jgi:O-antigen/teichoic acid export membrane protein